MNYSRHHNLQRRVFFWVLTVIYFIIAGTVIPYTLGYRFSFERGIFIYAGSITIKTNPRDVQIIIDGEQLPDKLRNIVNGSVHIDGLTPGTHTIKLEADGFHSWEKTVAIHSGISTEFWNIVLPRISYDTNNITDKIAQNFFLAPNHKQVAFTRQDDDTFSIDILDINNSQIHTIYTGTNFAQNISTQNIEWSPRADKIIVPVLTKMSTLPEPKKQVKKIKNLTNSEIADIKITQQPDFLIIDNNTSTIIRVRELLPHAQKISNVRWHPHKKNTIAVLADYTLWEISLTDHVPSIIAQNVATYTIASNTFYYINNHDYLLYRGSDKQSTQITTTPSTYPITKNAKLFVYDDDRVALITNDAHLLFFNNDNNLDKKFVSLADNVRGAHFSYDGKKMIWWTTNEISVIFVRKHDIQPTHKQNERFSIARFSNKIDNVQWNNDYEHILYTVGDKIKITSLDQRSGHYIADIAQVVPDTTVRFEAEENRIYLIVHHKDHAPQFSSIIFPEKKESLF